MTNPQCSLPDKKSPAFIRYLFEDIHHCEMCGHDTSCDKVMGLRLNKSIGLNPMKRSGVAVSVMKCRQCGLIYNQPMPIPGNIQDHYDTPPETYWQENYFKEDQNYFTGQIAEAKKLLGDKTGLKALDIGAGLGKCMIALENAGFEAYGFEPSKPFFERAISKMNIPPGKLKLGMMEEMDYPRNSFDFITFGAVLEHLYHPASCIEKALSWLKPEGVIHLEVPSSRHLIGRLFNFYYRLRFTNYVTNTSPMHMPFHLYEFSLRSFLELGKKLNFRLVAHRIDVCEIMHIPGIFHPFLRAYMKWTKTGMQLTGYLMKTASI